MVIELTPEQERLIATDAASRGVPPAEFVQDILRKYEEYRADYVAAVERGLAADDAGDVIEHEAFFHAWEKETPDRNPVQ